ncbi:winged helix-turn-helix transcriptional regulator [Ancylobacter polymorphus]|uniref:DNA-binding HxlR family transcriptional regulator n=1 Tax=Ancylobacter polymorphus TaxID=223390 RepID=A0ABU0B8U4_9HYPH|nr:helix-turn-helix domain-containing protein [Ancylobacter polymorphus]MDQ0302235.1 DNA-binding HxlR family transcriptional regulator [Ancylobacter polymorphus]
MKLDSHEFRSRCSIARALEIIGDRWTLLVIRDLMWHGKDTFLALQGSEERIPANLLAQRLKRLEALGILRREAYQQRPVRYRYLLTEEGLSLEPVLLELMAWGHAKLEGGFYHPDTQRSVPAGTSGRNR